MYNDSETKGDPIVARSSSDRAAIGLQSGYDRSSSSYAVYRPMSDRDDDPMRQIIPRDASNREGSRPFTPHPTPVKKKKSVNKVITK